MHYLKRYNFSIIICIILIIQSTDLLISQTMTKKQTLDNKITHSKTAMKNNISLFNEITYNISDWSEDTLGNHRAIVEVSKKDDAVWAHIPWRRSDLEPEKKNILVFDVQTGKQINNRIIINNNRKFGDIVFQPVTVPGKYFVYYFPYKPEGMYYWGDIRYIEPNNLSDPIWMKKNRLDQTNTLKGIYKTFAKTEVIAIECRGEINNFYPMEVIATKDETQKLFKKQNGLDYLLFPEDRKFPIRMTDDLPKRWIDKGPDNKFIGESMKGEGYAFQIGLYAYKYELKNLKVEISNLINQKNNASITSDLINCFNLGGIDWKGNKFEKIVNVNKGKILPLWFEIMVPKDTDPGIYSGTIIIKPENLKPTSVNIQINIIDQLCEDAGDNEPWRHSRMRWLNSTIGLDDEVTKPFIPMQRKNNIISCLGRKVIIDNLGLPENIQSYFTPEMTKIHDKARDLLSAPFSFQILNSENRQIDLKSNGYEITKENQGIISWKTLAVSNDFNFESSTSMEYDGFIEYKIILTANNDINVNDISLNIPVKSDVAKYAMGMGLKGGYRTEKLDWKWDAEKHQDAVWIGDVNAGLQCNLHGENYQRPLVNVHYKHKKIKIPPAWHNNGKGGVKIYEMDSSTVLLKAYSGKRSIKAGEKLHFYFTLLITPFKTLDTKGQWRDRYFHYPNRRLYPIDSIKITGANVINVHHANPSNPYINYPFLTSDIMKKYIDEAHEKGLKVKIYYTNRELSNHIVESYAWRSLGDEIYADGPGGGNATLREHYYSNYIPAWYEGNWKDAAIINSGMSRLQNYYLEGLNWLTSKVGIDGLYLDDVAYDRIVMKRVRKILDRTRPDPLIDLHSWNHYNDVAGFANNANLYMESMPYINRLWLGEVFDYNNTNPDYWMVEISGIPYGLMGEMLQDGGNPWRGLIYGMTNRLPWLGDPKEIWKIWDEFGIQESEMIGYWSPNCPVKTDNTNILSTVYTKKDKVLISIASWAANPVECKLNIDWVKLGFDPKKMILVAPDMKDFQPAKFFEINDRIPITPGKGWLLILKQR